MYGEGPAGDELDEPCDRRVGERVLAAVRAMPLAVLGAMALFAQATRGVDPLGLVIAGALLTPAALLGGFAWQGHRAEVRARLFPAVVGGMIAGFVGLFGGIVGAAGGLVVGAVRRPAR